MTMTPEQQKEFIKAVALFVADEVKQGLEPLQRELAALTLKLEHAELRARELRYAGTWSDKGRYRKGNFCTHSGALWHCNFDDVATVPGHDHDGWTLAVKSMARA